MPSALIPREGIYIDPIAKWLSYTMFNPILTTSLLLLLHISLLPESTGLLPSLVMFPTSTTSVSILQVCTALGLVFWINQHLNLQANNNWTPANVWKPNQEIVLITGGSGGIGASIAKRLAFDGTRVVLIDVVPLTFKLGESEGARQVTYYQADLSDMKQIKEVMARIRKEVGDPTVLINNAALSRGVSVLNGTYHDHDLTFRINLLAPFLITKEVLPPMVKKNIGHIINISSMSAYIPPAQVADYAATKAGLIVFHEALGMELKYEHKAPNVRTSLFVLSFVKTPLFDGKTNQSSLTTPLLNVETVGEAIVDTLYKGLSRTCYMPGIMRYLTWVRGAPDWIQHEIRTSTTTLKVNFKGRQKVDAKGKLL